MKAPKPKKSAWPLYLWFYFPLVCIISIAAYCSVEVYTADKPSLFYPLAAIFALLLGYHSDRVARDPFL
jgi:hypothetical protein